MPVASTHPDTVTRCNLYDYRRLTATVVASGGAITQPSSMVITVINPVGSLASYVFGQAGASIANPTTGCFYKDYTFDYVGTWGYAAHASGIVAARERWTVIVDPEWRP